MAAEMKKVFSSTVNEIGYDEEAKELVVAFKNGTYAYSGVDPATADSVIRAPSVGSAIHSEIKGKFPTRKV